VATIRDVARESGVSVATVSYVLNDGPRPVRPETRDRVLAAMRRLDYHPSALARGMVRHRLHTLGVLFGGMESAIVSNPYAALVLTGAIEAAAGLGYNVTLFTQPWVDARRSAPAFRDRRTDGVLVVAPFADSDMVPGLAGLGIPLVVVSSPSDAHGVPWVDTDNRAGGRMAGEHLIALGHRRIAYLGGYTAHAAVGERRAGLQDALAAAGLALPPEYASAGTYDNPDVTARAHALLSLPEPPTAVFVGNDIMALRVMEVARQRGFSVPGDLSIVGFDDIAAAAVSEPPLTTVRQPLAAIGGRAARLLVAQVEAQEKRRRRRRGAGETAGASAEFAVPPSPLPLPAPFTFLSNGIPSPGHVERPELVVRASTGPPPAAGKGRH
jgi:LacI family transcriptional regulator